MDYSELALKPSKQVLNALVKEKTSLYPFSLSYLLTLPSPEERNVFCKQLRELWDKWCRKEQKRDPTVTPANLNNSQEHLKFLQHLQYWFNYTVEHLEEEKQKEKEKKSSQRTSKHRREEEEEEDEEEEEEDDDEEDEEDEGPTRSDEEDYRSLASILQAGLEARSSLRKESASEGIVEGKVSSRRKRKRRAEEESDDEEAEGEEDEWERKKQKHSGNSSGVSSSKGEKRLSRYRSAPSKALLERIDQALEQRMYLIGRPSTLDNEEMRREYSVLSQTGSIFHVTLATLPSCNCPDSAKGHHCAHILFVLLKVLKVPIKDPVLYQRALLHSELAAMYKNAPAGYDGGYSARITVGEKPPLPRKPLEGDCFICMEALGQSEELAFCKEGCGQNVHKDCHDNFVTCFENQGLPPRCPYCQVVWQVEKQQTPMSLDVTSTPPWGTPP